MQKTLDDSLNYAGGAMQLKGGTLQICAIKQVIPCVFFVKFIYVGANVFTH